ncbi:hypothetical protein NW766_004441 [Fusarium irregulare]|uniref:Uncharacterized protein n=1 Tax=Fusarium irregulare TaxID=2494466 RepID=A0A9W8PT54_9HYPO|nr:hypothetical protein NW766_004441 [Fusarium irregulare]
MDAPQANDWRELTIMLDRLENEEPASTLPYVRTRRTLHHNMVGIRDPNVYHGTPAHMMSFRGGGERRFETEPLPCNFWRMEFLRRLARIRMNETSPNVIAELRVDSIGLPTTEENMRVKVLGDENHIQNGRNDNFINLALPIDDIWEILKSPPNQEWIRRAVNQNRIRFRNLWQLRTILLRTRMPHSRPHHIAFARALSQLFYADGSPIYHNPIKFLDILMGQREQIVADLDAVQHLYHDLQPTFPEARVFVNSPDPIPAMARLVASNPTTRNQQTLAHTRLLEFSGC